MNRAILLIVCITAFYIGECVCGGRAPKSSVKPYRCLEGGGGNHGCGNGNGKAAPVCTRYNTTLYGKGMCNQHGGTQNDSVVSFLLTYPIF